MAVDYREPELGDQIFMLYLTDEEFAIAEVMHYAYLVVEQMNNNLIGYSANWKVKRDGVWRDLLFKKQLHRYIVESKADNRIIEHFIRVIDRTNISKGDKRNGKTVSVEQIMGTILSLAHDDPEFYNLPAESQMERVREEFS